MCLARPPPALLRPRKLRIRPTRQEIWGLWAWLQGFWRVSQPGGQACLGVYGVWRVVAGEGVGVGISSRLSWLEVSPLVGVGCRDE